MAQKYDEETFERFGIGDNVEVRCIQHGTPVGAVFHRFKGQVQRPPQRLKKHTYFVVGTDWQGKPVRGVFHARDISRRNVL